MPAVLVALCRWWGIGWESPIKPAGSFSDEEQGRFSAGNGNADPAWGIVRSGVVAGAFG